MRKRRRPRISRKPVSLILWPVLFLLIFPFIFFYKEFTWLAFLLFHPYLDPALGRALAVTTFSLCAGFLPVLILWLLLVSGQAIVPINTMNERIRTAWHLFLFMLGRHGVATAIRDGKIQSTEDPLPGPPGLLVIDFNSAVVVEENIPVPGLTHSIRTIWHHFLIHMGLMDTPETPRVFGPGLAFLRPGAYIHSVVDLRRQFRIRTKVSAYTRDGIEIRTNIWALFRVGYDHKVLPLTFTLADREDPCSLRLMDLEETADGRIKVTRITADYNLELDRDDLSQIEADLTNPSTVENVFRYNLQPQTAQIPAFNPRHAFSAAFSDALDEDGKVIPWHELPVKVAADLYRHLLLEYNYDQLYGSVEQQDDRAESDFRIRRVRSILRMRLRNSGMLNFRLVLPARRPLQVGQVYSPNELVTSQVFPLTASKVLRNAGITVIFNGFGDLIPVSEAVYLQRLDSWRSRWYEDVKLVEADRELDAIHESTRARMQTQQDLVRRLRQVIESTTAGPNSAAFQVYMELEALASDPATRRLLPHETVMLMRMLHDWASTNEGKNGNNGGFVPPQNGRREA